MLRHILKNTFQPKKPSGLIFNDLTRVTNVSRVSARETRDLQMLRHVSVNVLYCLNTIILPGTGSRAPRPVEVQGVWVPSLQKVIFTANVGASVSWMQQNGIANLATVLGGVRHSLDTQKPTDFSQKAKRHNAKLRRSRQGLRKFEGGGHEQLVDLLLNDGRIDYVDIEKGNLAAISQEGGPPVVFLTHGYDASGTVRHAEQVLLQFLMDNKIIGNISMSGTKIPCFTCHAEFQYWKSFFNIRFFDMSGALFRNTLNPNLLTPGAEKVMTDRITGNFKMNQYTEVDSDSDSEDDEPTWAQHRDYWAAPSLVVASAVDEKKE